MSNFEEYDVYDKRDFVLDILLTLAAAVGFYVYWAFTLFVLSLILLNVWHVSWQQILIYATILTIVSMIVYIVKLVKKRIKR